jgi:hypothetical protein
MEALTRRGIITQITVTAVCTRYLLRNRAASSVRLAGGSRTDLLSYRGPGVVVLIGLTGKLEGTRAQGQCAVKWSNKLVPIRICTSVDDSNRKLIFIKKM